MTLFQGIATLVSAAMISVFYYLMALSAESPVKQLSGGHSFRMPDSRFHNSPDELYDFFKKTGEKGRPLLRRFWLLDFGFIAGLLGIMLIIDLNLMEKIAAVYLLMNAVAIARAVFDVAENLCFLRLERTLPERKNGLAAFAGVMTSAKSVCLYGWLGILFVKLVLSSFGIIK